MTYLHLVVKAWAEVTPVRHRVVTHCVDTQTWGEFLAAVGQPKAHYAFDRGGAHWIVLDAYFRSDGKPYGPENAR